MSALPELPYPAWEQTKETLHLWAQIVGKVKLASTAPRNHWWNVPLYVGVRGLTTRRMQPRDDLAFAVDFDFLDHALVVRTDRGDSRSFALHDGLSVAEFDRRFHAALAELDLDVEIKESPFGVPTTTPFPEDVQHASYDADYVVRFWRALEWVDGVLDEFSGWYCGKASPVHLFWHSFDLAHTRFSGRRAPSSPDADPVTREAYSHEAISFGFWPGDASTRFPAFYSYTAPEPANLADQPLRPEAAAWVAAPTGSLAVLPYDAVREAEDPKATLLAFLLSAYDAGARAAGWDREELTSAWCPAPHQLDSLLL
jgi:hypothetical protein